MLRKIAHFLIRRAEKRLNVSLDYTHAIAEADFGLLSRYNRIFGFLDPNRNLPPEAYHAARLISALAADCGTCVEAEINLALQAGLSKPLIKAILTNGTLTPELAAVVALSRAVTAERADDSEAREIILQTFGKKGLIELSYAMNGAALLPGIKRAMGYATACNIGLMRNLD
jgi:alkylhydroperoxidase family enzyme